MFGAIYFAQYPTVVQTTATGGGKWGSWVVITDYNKSPKQLLTNNNNG